MVLNVLDSVQHCLFILDVIWKQVTFFVNKVGLDPIAVKVINDLIKVKVKCIDYFLISSISAVCRENCQHGHCTNQPGQCFCYPGWTGLHCEKSLKNETEPEASCPLSCLNGGKCLSKTCLCPPGYRGRRCEERICLNGGLSSSGKCRCPPNYQGERCEIESKCPICRNGATCVENKCLCPKGFIGQYCEINVELLQKKPSTSFISIELIIFIGLLVVFLVALIVLSCLFQKFVSQRRKQLEQIKQINLEKVWTIETHSKNLYQTNFDSPKEKTFESKDINSKLKENDEKNFYLWNEEIVVPCFLFLFLLSGSKNSETCK